MTRSFSSSSQKMREIINIILREDVPNNSQQQSTNSTNSKEDMVTGASGGSVNAADIARILGLNNPQSFTTAINLLKNNTEEKQINNVITDAQAWTLADALWKLVSADPQTKMKVMGKFRNIVSKNK